MQAKTYTQDDYLALDAEAEDARYEFDGVSVWALAGAQPEHNIITSNVGRELGNRFVPEGCRIMQSDQRVQAGRKYVYPDVVATCREPEYTDDNPPSLLNPELIVEVESASTTGRDRGWKMDAYLEQPSLQAYWIVASEEPRMLRFVRGDGSWRLPIYHGLEASIESNVFGFTLALADIYRLVFP